MGSYSYVSLADLKARLSDTATTDDAVYRRELESASEEIDRICGRTFRVYLATLYATARYSNRLYLPADLLAVTTLKTDDSGDQTFENTWDAADDYLLKPRNASRDRR